jgi:squalene-associated FAD-dependent desaturase
MPRPTIHIVGAGLAGLAASLRLNDGSSDVVLHEATDHAGGRCRSYYEPALGAVIDNGNHLLLSGNHAALDYLGTVGSLASLVGPDRAEFDFADLKSGARWRLRPNEGRLPWWIFDPRRRVPGSRARDYLAIARLLRAAPGATIGEVIDCRGLLHDRLWNRLWHPLLLAALNTEPEAASAALAAAILRESLMLGGRACRPLVAKGGLSAAFIDPAVKYLTSRGAQVCFGHRLRALEFEGPRAAALDFGADKLALGTADSVVLAVPAPVAASLVPQLTAPSEFRAIINAHFRIAAPPGFPTILAVVNGTVEWLFAFEGRMSVTISGADRLIDTDREVLARDLWGEVARLTSLPASLPAWQIVKERRATFAALPAEEAKRPPTETSWPNLILAGDWTQTGLPATIEGAIRSGNRAAEQLRRTGL